MIFYTHSSAFGGIHPTVQWQQKSKLRIARARSIRVYTLSLDSEKNRQAGRFCFASLYLCHLAAIYTNFGLDDIFDMTLIFHHNFQFSIATLCYPIVS